MESRVKLSKDGTSIDFATSDSLPTSQKKFRQSPEIEGFYRFIFENDLQKEALEILERIISERKGHRSVKAAPPRPEAAVHVNKQTPGKPASKKSKKKK